MPDMYRHYEDYARYLAMQKRPKKINIEEAYNKSLDTRVVRRYTYTASDAHMQQLMNIMQQIQVVPASIDWPTITQHVSHFTGSETDDF